jgi:outer membrane protein assembly factor BamB
MSEPNLQSPAPLPPSPEFVARWAVTARRTGIVAAAFCAVVALVSVFSYQPQSREEPLTSAELKQKRTQLVQRPKDEKLKQEIRRLDASIRTQFFATRGSRQQGAWLLLAGAILAIAALKISGKLTEVPDDPRQRPAPDPRLDSANARSGLSMTALALLGGLVVLALSSRDVPGFAEKEKPDGDGGGAEVVKAPDFPTLEEWNREWPIFRGPSGEGLARTDTAPREWDGAAGKNVLWKVPVPPLPGDNSPVVWGKRLFICGATKEKREVYALDTETGRLLWQQEVKDPGTVNVPPPKPMEETGFAPNTMATDGRRVYAIFVNMDLAAFTVEGKPVWVKNLGKADNAYGHASSLSMWRNLLIVQFDQKGNDKSALIAFDGATGKQVWRTARPVGDCWSTPLTIRGIPQEEIVCSGRPWTMGYAPADGKERWRAKLLDADIAPTPCYGNGMVFVTNAYATLAAVRLGGSGDVTKTHVAWQADEGLPDCVSPLCDGEHLYLFDSTGLLTCYDAKEGKKRYEQEFKDLFNASPVLVGKMLYCLDTKGVMHFIEAGPTYREVGTATLGEEAHASPAVFRDRIYIRGRQHVFAIGAKP